MEASIECTHCRVVMTSWSAPGSPIRYYQCPFCARTHSSQYGEVFRRRAGARIVDVPERAARPSEIPMASPEDVRWASVKKSAARWFARLEADQRRCASPAVRAARAAAAANDVDFEIDVPEIDPIDLVEVVEVVPVPIPVAAGRRR